jgi:hypothetical protein
MFRDVVRAPTSAASSLESTFSAPAYSPPAASYSSGASSGASGFAPEYAPAYAPSFMGSPQVMTMDAVESRSSVMGILAVTMMGVSISGIAFAALRLRRRSSTMLEDPLV